VGNSLVDTGVLRPYRVSYKETIVNIQNIAIERARWTDELSRTTEASRDAWRRHIEVVTPEGSFRETVDILVDAKTFAPLKTFERNTSGSMSFVFAGATLVGERMETSASTSRKISEHPAVAFFDYYGGMMELFLATLPFQKGSRLTFPATMATTDPSADAAAIDWPIVEMKGEEPVSVGGVPYRAFRIEVNTPYGFYRVWARKEPPFVVRTILLIPPGGRIMYDLVPG